jgi:hypothetical protein
MLLKGLAGESKKSGLQSTVPWWFFLAWWHLVIFCHFPEPSAGTVCLWDGATVMP